MRALKERNTYLGRIGSHPRKYFFEIDSGKYFLYQSDGTQKPVNKNGQLQSKFRLNFTGFASSPERQETAKRDSSAMGFTPDSSIDKENCFYTPVTRKFAGYAQQPYQIGKSNSETYLVAPNRFTTHHHPNFKLRQKHKRATIHKSDSLIMSNAASIFSKETKTFYKTASESIMESKPLPKNIKKTCYNYHCKFHKNMIFDQKMQDHFESSQKLSQTLSKPFFDDQILREKKEFSDIKINS